MCVADTCLSSKLVTNTNATSKPTSNKEHYLLVAARHGFFKIKRPAANTSKIDPNMLELVDLLLVHSCLIMSVSSFLIMRLALQPPLLLPANVASAATRGHGGGGDGCGVSDEAPAPAPPPPPMTTSRNSSIRRHCCERCAASSWPDVVAAVTSTLRLDADDDHDDDDDDDGGDDGTKCGGCAAKAAAEDLLERKEATERELREAFRVLDRDGDGFVGAGDLRDLLRRLGMMPPLMLMPEEEEEGEGEEEWCARMIAAHDGDGDGRVSFREFRAMMEHAV